MNYEDHSDDAAKVAEKLELYSEAATIKKETVAWWPCCSSIPQDPISA